MFEDKKKCIGNYLLNEFLAPLILDPRKIQRGKTLEGGKVFYTFL